MTRSGDGESSWPRIRLAAPFQSNYDPQYPPIALLRPREAGGEARQYMVAAIVLACVGLLAAAGDVYGVTHL